MKPKYLTKPYTDLAWHKFIVGLTFGELDVVDRVYSFYQGTWFGDKLLAYIEEV